MAPCCIIATNRRSTDQRGLEYTLRSPRELPSGARQREKRGNPLRRPMGPVARETMHSKRAGFAR